MAAGKGDQTQPKGKIRLHAPVIRAKHPATTCCPDFSYTAAAKVFLENSQKIPWENSGPMSRDHELAVWLIVCIKVAGWGILVRTINSLVGLYAGVIHQITLAVSRMELSRRISAEIPGGCYLSRWRESFKSPE